MWVRLLRPHRAHWWFCHMSASCWVKFPSHKVEKQKIKPSTEIRIMKLSGINKRRTLFQLHVREVFTLFLQLFFLNWTNLFDSCTYNHVRSEVSRGRPQPTQPLMCVQYFFCISCYLSVADAYKALKLSNSSRFTHSLGAWSVLLNATLDICWSTLDVKQDSCIYNPQHEEGFSAGRMRWGCDKSDSGAESILWKEEEMIHRRKCCLISWSSEVLCITVTAKRSRNLYTKKTRMHVCALH